MLPFLFYCSIQFILQGYPGGPNILDTSNFIVTTGMLKSLIQDTDNYLNVILGSS